MVVGCVFVYTFILNLWIWVWFRQLFTVHQHNICHIAPKIYPKMYTSRITRVVIISWVLKASFSILLRHTRVYIYEQHISYIIVYIIYSYIKWNPIDVLLYLLKLFLGEGCRNNGTGELTSQLIIIYNLLVNEFQRLITEQ